MERGQAEMMYRRRYDSSQNRALQHDMRIDVLLIIEENPGIEEGEIRQSFPEYRELVAPSINALLGRGYINIFNRGYVITPTGQVVASSGSDSTQFTLL